MKYMAVVCYLLLNRSQAWMANHSICAVDERNQQSPPIVPQQLQQWSYPTWGTAAVSSPSSPKISRWITDEGSLSPSGGERRVHRVVRGGSIGWCRWHISGGSVDTRTLIWRWIPSSRRQNYRLEELDLFDIFK